MRHGIATLRPYLYGPPALVDWMKKTFGAQVLERTGAEGGEHVELKIGDSVLVLETGGALPADKPYQERGAGVKDSFGNTWWFATYTGARTQVNKLVAE
jgi:PhnB protein